MKMRYLKTFENFTDMGRFSDVDSDEQDWLDKINPSPEDEFDEDETEECEPCDDNDEEYDFDDEEDFDEFGGEEPMRRKVWGDEVIESKKNKKKPDFLDVDKDGNKKESMKKALKDKEEKKDDKKSKGDKLTAAQKKLPEGLRKAIEARKK
jgi:hypothetical protein